ncbi:MAG: hypothetical protein IJA69_03665 [Clostridia bacterium]|nr:hypothetical protein [Clostridia bacterium]
MKNVNLVVLMGGNATRLEPVSYSLPKGLCIINSMPAIFNNIQQMIKRGLKQVTIVCNEKNIGVISQSFEKVYSDVLKLNFVIQKNANGPLGALQCANQHINNSTLVMLGDTLCDCDFSLEKSFVGYCENKNPDDFSRWCFLNDDETQNITGFNDKPKQKPQTQKIVMGVYFFKDHNLLKKLLAEDYESLHGEKQLSSLLSKYMEYESMFSQKIKNWKDIGTLEDYVKINTKLLNGRYFNNFKFNGQTIIKEGEASVIKYEIGWYKQINQTQLKVFVPHIIDYKISDGFYSYEMEYLNGHSLHIYNTFLPINLGNWEYILTNLMLTANNFWAYDKLKPSLDIVKAGENIYIEKTISRMKEWKNPISESEVVELNGQKLFGWKTVLEKLKTKIDVLIKNCKNNLSIIHGDMNFSNIFYYPEISGFKFIDPRGKFLEEGIWGDKRYDVAKMRHSFVYNHNKIVQGFFRLDKTAENCFNLVYDYDINKENLFNKVIKQFGFDAQEIKIIDGLLFLSQIPLHPEDKNFQIVSYLLGLKMLNECIGG